MPTGISLQLSVKEIKILLDVCTINMYMPLGARQQAGSFLQTGSQTAMNFHEMLLPFVKGKFRSFLKKHFLLALSILLFYQQHLNPILKCPSFFALILAAS